MKYIELFSENLREKSVVIRKELLGNWDAPPFHIWISSSTGGHGSETSWHKSPADEFVTGAVSKRKIFVPDRPI